MNMCKIYAVASQKGGVAKSSTVLNLATALGMMGKKVLAVDLDPQGSLSICAGVQNPDNRRYPQGKETGEII